MKKLLGSIALAACVATPAMAADIPVKAQPAPVEIYSWSGYYIAVGPGWRHNRVHWDYTNPVPATLAPFTNSNDGGSLAFISGAQRQFGMIVLGVEGATDISLSRGFGGTTGGAAAGPCTPSAAQTCQTRVGAIFTFGGKAGLAWNNFMVYGTGGWARGRIETRLLNAPGGPVDQTARNHDGWYLGIGGDYMMFQRAGTAILLGVEYQRVDLRNLNHTSPFSGFGPCPPGVDCRDIRATVDTIRARLTVKYTPELGGLLAGF